jgi:uncharacterized protein (DUF58 family)
MPTSRTVTFLSASLVLYLFANQTQVGWLYVMAALLGGIVVAAWWLNRGSLSGITGRRQIEQYELHEGDTATIHLSVEKSKGGSTSQTRIIETCPLAASDSKQRSIKLFVPSLPIGGKVEFQYEVLVDRRGLHEFPQLTFNSRAPFGFFRRERGLAVETRVLVYPEVHPLRRLDLLDRQTAPEVTRQRAGIGYEVMGVRPYRPGDSARHIHWRSVARRGELISKEFAEEAQPGLTLVLDLFAHPYAKTDSKHTPFEWMIKAAVSLAEYAQRKGYPLHILADGEVLPIPASPVMWTALLQYLARVQPTGNRRLADVVGNQPTQAFVAAIFPWPDTAAISTLMEIRHRRAEILALVLDPATFPDQGDGAGAFASQLTGDGIETREIAFGEDWAVQLSERNLSRETSK